METRIMNPDDFDDNGYEEYPARKRGYFDDNVYEEYPARKRAEVNKYSRQRLLHYRAWDALNRSRREMWDSTKDMAWHVRFFVKECWPQLAVGTMIVGGLILGFISLDYQNEARGKATAILEYRTPCRECNLPVGHWEECRSCKAQRPGVNQATYDALVKAHEDLGLKWKYAPVQHRSRHIVRSLGIYDVDGNKTDFEKEFRKRAADPDYRRRCDAEAKSRKMLKEYMAEVRHEN
jgi:hypothetical protein